MSSMLASRSARSRVLKHLQRQKAAIVAEPQHGVVGKEGEAAAPAELTPGQMQLYSYYAPSLQAGAHTITVTQHVETADNSQRMTPPPVSTQKFDVNAPRFTLPPGLVHSSYPPQGLSDQNNILPHIVFEDVHFPWERAGSPRQDHIDKLPMPNGNSPPPPANKVPWVALLTFTEDELKLSDAELKKKSEGGLFPEVTQIPPKNISADGSAPSGREQNKSTFSVQLTMGEYLEMGGAAGNLEMVMTPVQDNVKDDPIDPETQVDVIFVKADLVTDLFRPIDASGASINPITPGTLADVSRYKYLAHVRNVNTHSVAGAGLDDDGLYSVVVSQRPGPLEMTTPKPVIVHLITIEGIEAPITDKNPHFQLPLDPTKLVAFVSLYSWTYVCLPPEQVNFLDSMRNIGFSIEDGKCWLRAPDEVIARVAEPKESSERPLTPQEKIASRLADRLNDGFCLQRYRLHTGEETAAFYRGPFTPRYVPSVSNTWWPYQSNFSTDYQVVDKSLGIMDITYSAAWQLGRTLAIADQGFSAALVRLRGAVQTTARQHALKEQSARAVHSKRETITSLSSTIDALAILASAKADETTSPQAFRHQWTKPKAPQFQKRDATAHDSGIVAPDDVQDIFFRHYIMKTAQTLGSARIPSKPQAISTGLGQVNSESSIPFNDITVPTSTNWQIVQNWVLDNLIFFKNIPAHYYLPDPSYLPPESIRFFYVDNTWVDACIDGALSVGNHLDRKDDTVRQAFKENLNNYFKSKYSDSHPDSPQLSYHPQIPCFGFLLRSAVVKAFPDLEVHVPWKAASGDNEGQREPTLRFESIAKDTLICLFDRMPGQDHWDDTWQITLSQPPHQQCFRLGTDGGLINTQLEVEFPPIYTTTDNFGDLKDRYNPLRVVKWFQNGSSPQENSPKSENFINAPELPNAIFSWQNRLLLPNTFSVASQTVLARDMTQPPPPDPKSKEYYGETVPTSAMVGTVLTCYMSKMRIDVPVPSQVQSNQPPDYSVAPRQIRTEKQSGTAPSALKKVEDRTQESILSSSSARSKPIAKAATVSPQIAAPGGPPALPINFDAGAMPDIPPDQQANITDPAKKTIHTLSGQFATSVFVLGQQPPPLPPPGTSPRTGVTRGTIIMPATVGLPIDLVVGMNRLDGCDTDHKLQFFSMMILLPCGNKVTDLLVPGARCSSARMLRNARFNVHVSPFTDPGEKQEYLKIMLIPRSTGKLVPLLRTKEANFMIGEVVLNGIPSHAGAGVIIKVTETYRWQNAAVTTGGYFDKSAFNPIMITKVQG